MKQYPNDPYKDESHWPEGFGQLTNVSDQLQPTILNMLINFHYFDFPFTRTHTYTHGKHRKERCALSN